MQKLKFRREDGGIVYVHAGNGTDLVFANNGDVYVETATSLFTTDPKFITQDRWERTLLYIHSKIFAFVDFTREDGVWMHVRGSDPVMIKGTELAAATLSLDLLDKAKAALVGNDIPSNDLLVRID